MLSLFKTLGALFSFALVGYFWDVISERVSPIIDFVVSLAKI